MRFKGTILFLLSIYIAAQDYNFSYNFVNYNINNGFPSSDVYYGIKDKKGFLWFATDKGVAIYNGISFENYTVDQNLADNKVISMYEDFKNNIWFCGENSLTKFDITTNEFFPYQYNNEIIKAHLKWPITTCFIDGEENVYLILKHNGYIKINRDGNFQYFNRIVLYDRGHGFYSKSGNIYKPEFWNKNYLPSSVFKDLINFDDNQEIYTNSESLVVKNGEHSIELQDFNNFKEENYTFQSQINSVSLNDFSNTILISTENGIEKYFPGQQKKLNYLNGYKINYTLDGNKNGLYVLSKDNGLFIIPNNGILTLNIGDTKFQKPISQLLSSIDNVFIIQEYNNYPLKYGNYEFNFQNHPITLSGLKSINPTTSNEGFKVMVDAGYQFENTPYFSHFDCLSFTFDGDILYVLSKDGIYKIIGKTIKKIKSLDSIIQQTNSICFFQNQLWVGTNIGWYSYKLNTDRLYFINSNKNYHVLSLKNYYDKKLIIATQNNGLLFYNDGKFTSLNTKNGLTSNLINDVAINNYKIWLATGNGIAELREENGDFKLTDAYSFSDGLNSTDITSIAIYDDEIFAGSKYGLNKITPFLKPKNYLKTYIKHIKINNKFVPISHNISVPHNASLDIDLMLNSYNSQTPVTYYRIKSLNDQFRITTNLNIVYESLNSGDYTLEYYSKDYIEQTPIQKIEISVQSPWYAKWYFLMPLFLLLAYLVYLFIIFYSNKIQSRYKKEQEINRYKLLAFNKQMSSHFISNSFNAINNFILKKDNVGSSRYLSKMSKLFRHSLLATEHNYIPFNQEIEAIKSYIELEKLRYNNSFNYQIFIDEDVPINRLSIMPLVLQTLIENAIWHGLLPSEREDKRLIIKIEKTRYPNLLNVIIEDNGIGIDLENLNKEESKGIQLVKSILQTNAYTKSINSENIINFVNIKDEGKNKGTICSIKIPIIISI